MIHSLLIGLVGGMRALSPLAAVTVAARRNALPHNNGASSLLANPMVSNAVMVLAVGELLGDKIPSAPDRIIPPGIAARVVTGAVAGAALAPRDQRATGALLGAAGAVAGAYLSFNGRMRLMDRYDQVSTGIVEDALMLAATQLIVGNASHSGREPANRPGALQRAKPLSAAQISQQRSDLWQTGRQPAI